MQTYDSLVIGGGPAGMTAALYLLRSGVNLAWTEKLAPGGQVLNTEWIDNYPGFPKGIKGFELADLMAEQVQGFTFDRVQEEVEEINPRSDGYEVKAGDELIKAKTILICTGAEHRKLGLPGEEELSGKGVSYCALCDGQFFRDQIIACIGGGNTALEESLYLSGLASKVYLVHRRKEFRGDKVYQDKVLAEPKIETVLDTVPLNIKGDKEVQGLEVKNVQTGDVQTLDVDGVFIFVGIIPQGGFFPEELRRDGQGFIITDTEMLTNMPGIFAAGDIRSKRCRQVTTAVGDGATAAFSAYTYLEENK